VQFDGDWLSPRSKNRTRRTETLDTEGQRSGNPPTPSLPRLRWSHRRAAWPKESNEGRPYLSHKLDDPSFTAPIFANLFDDPDGESFTLIWSRSSKKNGE
jgi:hypothetical protein